MWRVVSVSVRTIIKGGCTSGSGSGSVFCDADDGRTSFVIRVIHLRVACCCCLELNDFIFDVHSL